MRASERRLAIFVAVGMLVAWAAFFLSVFDPRGRWVAENFGPREDGNWIALTIDGRQVRRGALSLFIDGGEPRSGHDGCNRWSRVKNETGEAGVESTLVLCSPDPIGTVYRQLVFGPHKLDLRPNGMLVLTGSGHRALFRRQQD